LAGKKPLVFWTCKPGIPVENLHYSGFFHQLSQQIRRYFIENTQQDWFLQRKWDLAKVGAFSIIFDID